MQTSLIATKLHFPPHRPSLVPRHRLVGKIQAGLAGPLTLISAPAGSGKTTILSQWRMGPGSNAQVAWLSLDSADNDPSRFFQYLSASLEPLQPGLIKAVLPLLPTTEPPNLEAVTTLIVNHFSSLKRDVVLILDDYHLIDNSVIHTAFIFLLDHLPPCLHLVLLSRADPPFPLSRLRARGQLIEIREADLRFNVVEATQFLNQVMSLNLTSQQIEALENRTEGWIAGLQLAALSMQGRDDLQEFISAFTGSNHYIVDYLAEEVLDHQPAPLREFLLKTSILDHLTGSLCNALTGENNGDSVLKDLDHANLFTVPLDDEQRWFRYHHLFADLLRIRLHHSYPDMILDLHSKASTWFEANNIQDEAITHALAAKDYENAARLFSRDRLDIMYTHSINTLDKWLQAFPDSFLRTNPWLCIAKAHILWTGRREEMEPYIASAEESLSLWEKAGRIGREDQDYQILSGEILSFQSMIAAIHNNKLDTALEMVQKAVQIIPKTARNRIFALGCMHMAYKLAGNIDQAIETCYETILAGRTMNYPSMRLTTAYTLAQLLRFQGRLKQASQVLQDELEFTHSHGQGHLFYTGILHIGMAELLYEYNDLDGMELELGKGLTLCRQGGTTILVVIGLLAQAQLRHARGDLPGAIEVLNEIEREASDINRQSMKGLSIKLRLKWQADQGDLSGISSWFTLENPFSESKVGTDYFSTLSFACFYLYVLDRNEEALEYLYQEKEIAKKAGTSGWLIDMLVLESIIWKKMDNISVALDCLKQALILAEPEGHVRVFVDYGQPVYELLKLLQKREARSGYIARLLPAFEPHSHENKNLEIRQSILSRREMDVLHLLAKGCTNKQISEALVIAPETVHKHLKNIYDELSVHSRTAAIARARELGML